MKKVLIIMGRYLPGYKDGGPVRSIKNLTDRLGKEYDFRILTVDRDHGDEQAYPNIISNGWNKVGHAKVWYVAPGGFTKQIIIKLVKDVDVVYMCGCFNDYARAVLALKKQGKISSPVVIAAMGLFSPGAFHIKYLKKKAYMLLLGSMGYFQNIVWSATSQEEAGDIRREAGRHVTCYLAEDLPRKVEQITHTNSSEEGNLRIIFLSRISRKKNLTYAIKILQKLGMIMKENQKVIFDIYGNLEDQMYWQECQTLLYQLPSNIQWKYQGIADAEQITQIFSQYDVFLFPTMGENYGHVIFEAVSGGSIPVISDQTPWTVEKLGGVGEVLKLGSEEPYAKVLLQYLQMNQETLARQAEQCLCFAKQYSATEAEEGYRTIFQL